MSIEQFSQHRLFERLFVRIRGKADNRQIETPHEPFRGFNTALFPPDDNIHENQIRHLFFNALLRFDT